MGSKLLRFLATGTRSEAPQGPAEMRTAGEDKSCQPAAGGRHRAKHRQPCGARRAACAVRPACPAVPCLHPAGGMRRTAPAQLGLCSPSQARLLACAVSPGKTAKTESDRGF